MKTFLVFVAICVSFSQARASIVPPPGTKTGQTTFIPAQIELISEPFNIEGYGNLSTIFISGADVLTEDLSWAGVYSNTLQFVINPNQCHTRDFGAICTEMGSRNLKAKLRVAKLSNGLQDLSNIEVVLVSDDGQEFKLAGKTGPVDLSLEVQDKANDPGIPGQTIYLVAKDSTGTRKALLSARVHF